MGHFVYEIDERSLRVRIKSLEDPLPEGAWEAFSAKFRDQNPQSQRKLSLPSIPLSRNVLIPAFFGIIVILLSVMLFNFVNISDDETASPARAEPVLTTPEAIQTPTTAPVITATVAAAVPPPATVTTPVRAAAQPTRTATPPAVTTPARTQPAANAPRTRTVNPRDRQTDEELEHLEDIRPVLVPEERNPEIRSEP